MPTAKAPPPTTAPPLETRALYLGVDVQADVSHYAILTGQSDKPQSGRVTIDGFPALLEQARPKFLACEFTGRLAVPYARLAKAADCRVFYLDTVSRAAYTRLFGQTSKTDKQDARTIVRVFRRWQEEEDEYRMNPHLFLEADLVEEAWGLRAMLFELRKLRTFQTSCGLKSQIAAKTLMPEMADRWMQIAASLPLDAAEREIATYAAARFKTEMDLLLTIPGVGPTLAPWILATLHPITRFETYWNAKRYIGLNPRQAESGRKKGQQRVSRTGNSTLRGFLYVTALSQTNRETRFGRYYRRKVAEGMPGKRAVVATAERIFRTAFFVLRSGTPYHDPNQPTPITAPARADLPPHLLTQVQAAARLGVSRQRIGQLVKSGDLRAQVWPDDAPAARNTYVVLKYLDILIAQRESVDKWEPSDEEDAEAEQ